MIVWTLRLERVRKCMYKSLPTLPFLFSKAADQPQSYFIIFKTAMVWIIIVWLNFTSINSWHNQNHFVGCCLNKVGWPAQWCFSDCTGWAMTGLGLKGHHIFSVGCHGTAGERHLAWPHFWSRVIHSHVMKSSFSFTDKIERNNNRKKHNWLNWFFI